MVTEFDLSDFGVLGTNWSSADPLRHTHAAGSSIPRSKAEGVGTEAIEGTPNKQMRVTGENVAQIIRM